MGGPELDEASGQDTYRRSIYFRHSPNKQMLILKIFDGADPNSCYERTESIMPQQALALANSKLGFTLARALTERLGGSSAPAKQFVDEAFEIVLGRFPSGKERELVDRFLTGQFELLADPARLVPFDVSAKMDGNATTDPALRARASLVHVLMNHTDFLTIR
jgi:hypothetical protein